MSTFEVLIEPENKSLEIMTEIFGANDWLQKIKALASPDIENSLQSELKSAAKGMGYCVDDRTVKSVIVNGSVKEIIESDKAYNLCPGMVGGALGWTLMFMMRGQSQENAFLSTKLLYEKMNWGNMVIHIDDDHGQIDDEEQLIMRNRGCGFAGQAAQIFGMVKEALAGLVISDVTSIDFNKAKGFVYENNGAIVVVTGTHSAEAKFVVNTIKDKTLDRGECRISSGAVYIWDMWATTGKEVYDKFLALDFTEPTMTENDFKKLQAAMHMATGFALNVLKPEKTEKLSNLVVLEN